MVAMRTLMDEVRGEYVVQTGSGATYFLDLNRHEMCRLPTPDDAAGVHDLRRDGATVRLLEVLECTIGQRMHLILDLGIDGVTATSRRTTTVTSITRLSPDHADRSDRP
ncbi:hypothetical protein [Cryobacterium sp. MDB2-10]|uniref:hypothetical protein n=1 Tax=Cryobacterium sp. MDB2-10 TaxID=1259177 RepID=UPI0010737AC0|nr:hypothetical protein [Cryobacterium sp. MDB2-10]TFC19910.1 hypothetical protein E3O51_06115 [Cryobacterium sp. MDB2-10]